MASVYRSPQAVYPAQSSDPTYDEAFEHSENGGDPLLDEFPDAYIYGLVDPATSAICYIGQTGDISRRLAHHHNAALHAPQQTRKDIWLRGCAGNVYAVQIDVVPHAMAEHMERAYILCAIELGFSLYNKAGTSKHFPVSRDLRLHVMSALNIIAAKGVTHLPTFRYDPLNTKALSALMWRLERLERLVERLLQAQGAG